MFIYPFFMHACTMKVRKKSTSEFLIWHLRENLLFKKKVIQINDTYILSQQAQHLYIQNSQKCSNK